MTAHRFNEGDFVRIVRKPSAAEFDNWAFEMNNAVGRVGFATGKAYVFRGKTVTFQLRVDGLSRPFWFPDCVLEPFAKTYGNEED